MCNKLKSVVCLQIAIENKWVVVDKDIIAFDSNDEGPNC